MSPFNPEKHHRRSIRLPNYDYTQAGAYFVTIVTYQRELLFDDPVLRRIVETFWQRIPMHVPQVQQDTSVVMANHLHGIMWMLDDDRNRRGEASAQRSRSIGSAATSGILVDGKSLADASPLQLQPGSLGAIIGNFKSITTRRINQVRKTPGQSVWQRNYYEHIIRNDQDLNDIRQYILDNSANWLEDIENPGRSM